MQEEIWRPAVGYEDELWVSNLGNVKSNHNDREKILKPCPDGKGYLGIRVQYVPHKYKYVHVHKLVAEAFCINVDKENRTYVDHIDGNRQNNNYKNLRWVTPSENRRNAYPYNLPLNLL